MPELANYQVQYNRVYEHLEFCCNICQHPNFLFSHYVDYLSLSHAVPFQLWATVILHDDYKLGMIFLLSSSRVHVVLVEYTHCLIFSVNPVKLISWPREHKDLCHSIFPFLINTNVAYYCSKVCQIIYQKAMFATDSCNVYLFRTSPLSI